MMKQFHVRLASDAEHDIVEICQYLAALVSRQRAEHVFEQLEDACKSLSNMPERGHFPPELERLGILEYREIHCMTYRILYQQIDEIVMIHAILDGRRDLQDLLFYRLLRDEVA